MSKHSEALPLLQERLTYLERSIARAEQQVSLRRQKVSEATTAADHSGARASQRLLDQAESDVLIAQERFDNLAETIALLKEDK